MADGIIRREFLHHALMAGITAMALPFSGHGFAGAAQAISLEGGWQARSGGDPHIPEVTTCREGQNVRIGILVQHVQTIAHHISAIRLYDQQRQELCSLSFHATLSVAEGLFVIRLPPNAVLFAVSDCNLHGLWMTRFTV